MKLTHILALAALLLSGAAQVQAGDPIPGVDVMLSNCGGCTPYAISNQAQGGVLPRATASKMSEDNSPVPSDRKAARRGGQSTDPTDGTRGKTATRAISDQSAGGNISSYGKGTSGGKVTPGPRPDTNSAMQGVSTTRKTSTSATINWGDGSPAKAVAGKVTENQSPLPTDRLLGKESATLNVSATPGGASKNAGKPAAPAIFDRWGNYSASNPAANTVSPQKDAERNPAQATAAARDKYNAQSGAGNIAGPTPLMNGPNAGLVMPATLSPTMQGPLMAPGGAMSPGGH